MTTYVDLIADLKHFTSYPDYINTLPERQRPYGYENIWRLLFYYQRVPLKGGLKYEYVEGNLRDGTNFKTIPQRELMTRKWNSGNKDGPSDITLRIIHDSPQEMETYILCSCKYLCRDEGGTLGGKYDLDTLGRFGKHLNLSYKIILLVRDSDQVTARLQKDGQLTYRDEVLQILGEVDIQTLFHNLCRDLRDDQIHRQLPLIQDDLRLHQWYGVMSLWNIFQIHNEALLGFIPRSGKSYIMMYMLACLPNRNVKGLKHAIIITPLPTETMNEYKNVINKYDEFKNYTVVELSDHTYTQYLNTDHVIFMTSKQLLDNDNNTDIAFPCTFIAYDENHYGGTTDKSLTAINRFRCDNTKILYVTGTYHKTAYMYGLTPAQVVTFTLEDRILLKARNYIDKGPMMVSAYHYMAASRSDDTIFNVYATFPTLQILTPRFRPEIITSLQNTYKGTAYGLSMKALFELTPEKTTFKHPTDVTTFMSYLIGSQKHLLFPDGDKSMFSRVRRILGPRGDFLTSLWFIPHGTNLLSKDVAAAIIRHLANDEVGKHYSVIDFTQDIKNPFDYINLHIQMAKRQNLHGLIILSAKKLTHGISLPKLDSVFFLNDLQSYDLYVQSMYRCLTEDVGKSFGVVVDFRVELLLSLYFQSINRKPGDVGTGNVNRELINIDTDYYTDNPTENFLEDLQAMEMKILDLNVEVIRKKFTVTELGIPEDSDVFKILQMLKVKAIKVNKIVFEVADATPGLGTGGHTTGNGYKRRQAAIDTVINIDNFVFELIKGVIIFNISTSSDMNLKTMVATLKDNLRLQGVFDCKLQDRIEGYGGSLFGFLVYILETYDLYTNPIIISYVASVCLLINPNDPGSYYKLLSQYLGVHIESKIKEFADIFTPLQLVTEMLDKLPLTVWTNPNLKWLEPGCGLCPFSYLAYQRLMIGLSGVFPNIDDRKSHILENMLHFVDIQQEHIDMVSIIFGRDFKIHAYCADYATWKLDPHSQDPFNPTQFNPTTFDVIIGNPPYNRPGQNKGFSLWEEFVTKNLELSTPSTGYMVFMHPSKWRKPCFVEKRDIRLTNNKNLQDSLFHRQMVYMELHNKDDGMKLFGGSTARYDWYVLQNCQCTSPWPIKFEGESTVTNVNMLPPLPFIPNYGFNIWNKILAKKFPGINVQRIRDTNKNKCQNVYNPTTGFVYPVVRSTNLKGLDIYYTTQPSPIAQMKKVIMSRNYNLCPVYDDGQYSVTETPFIACVNSEDEGQRMVEYLNTPLMKYLVASCRWCNIENNWETFRFIPHVNTFPQADDEFLHDVFELSPDEIKIIEGDRKDDVDTEGEIKTTGMTVVQLKALGRQYGLQFKNNIRKGELQALIDTHLANLRNPVANVTGLTLDIEDVDIADLNRQFVTLDIDTTNHLGVIRPTVDMTPHFNIAISV
jgi:hypothetical protein